MRILVRMPNWLGDAVMATPALGNLLSHFPQAGVVLVTSAAARPLFAADRRFLAVCEDSSKAAACRAVGLARLTTDLRRRLGPFDLALAFPNSLSSALLLWLSGSRRRVGARRGWGNLLLTDAVPVDRRAHQAEIYNAVVSRCLAAECEAGPPWLDVAQRANYPGRTLGISPGAAYGSAKRWPPQRFAQVAAALADRYETVLVFGSPAEVPIAGQVEAALCRQGVTNYRNLAGKTSVAQLVSLIGGLDLMITNDSGPMHIAGAMGVPTVAIFGSTNHLQTSPWRHPRLAIVRHDLPCAPCMRRTCPLGHHACMEQIEAAEVIAAADRLSRLVAPVD